MTEQPDIETDTLKKGQPFWRRTVYIAVRGQAGAVEQTEFNWTLMKPLALVFAILFAAGLFWMAAWVTVAGFGDGIAILKICAPVMWFVWATVVYAIGAETKIWR